MSQFVPCQTVWNARRRALGTSTQNSPAAGMLCDANRNRAGILKKGGRWNYRK